MITRAQLDQLPRTAADLQSFLPKGEDGDFEFKCSPINDDSLQTVIQAAASGFWNSGGGYFVVGVDNQGLPDGGVTTTVGRQARRDWIDRALAKVDPPFSNGYAISEIEASPGRAIYLIGFATSDFAPHMAPDKKYYVRAGAHTDPASNFLVEAIRARRGQRQPQLRVQFRRDPLIEFNVQLGIINVGVAAAIDVEVEFEQKPPSVAIDPRTGKATARIHLIDRETPFYLHYFQTIEFKKDAPDNPLKNQNQLTIRYRDSFLTPYEETIVVDPRQAVFVTGVDAPVMDRLAQSIQNIATTLSRIEQRSILR